MTLTRKLSHEDINSLPLRAYEGVIHQVRTDEQMDAAVQKLFMERVIGFDIESKPCFSKGEKHPPALLQLAASDCVYIFRLIDRSLPDSLCALLSDERVVKSGVALRDDLKDLRGLREFTPAGFIDLGEAARKGGLQHHGLKGMAALLMGFRISKSAQRSNWASEHLTEKQIVYAATDAWLSRELYFELLRRGVFNQNAAPNGEDQSGATES